MSRRMQWGVLAVIVAAAAGGVAFRVVKGAKPLPERAVIVYDRSDSTRDICDAVVGVTGEVLTSRRFGKGASIIVLATGDDATLGEPLEVFRFDDFRRARTVEGRSAAAKMLGEILEKVRAACESTPRAGNSPVYLAVRRGAELVGRPGCTPSHCTLAVVSDGEETVEPGLAAALRKGGRAKKQLNLPARIANEASRVTWCGLAETVAPSLAASAKGSTRAKRALEPKRDAGRADRLLELWRGLFTEPASVEFLPVCPKRKLDA